MTFLQIRPSTRALFRTDLQCCQLWILTATQPLVANGKDHQMTPLQKATRKRKRGTFVCPVCLENIAESTKTKQGQDAIFCEGSCDTWLHRKHAGLSKSVFTKLDKNVPYICPHCWLQAQENEIKTLDLKTAVDMLTKTINELKAKLQPAVDSNNATQPADLICLGHSAPVTTAAYDPSPKEKVSQADHKSIKNLGYSSMKPQQMMVTSEFINQRDVFTVLPTGFGKTLCFTCLPIIFDELYPNGKPLVILVASI